MDNFESFSFEIIGRPLVQKNNIKIRQKKVRGGRTIPFIGHSTEMTKYRDQVTKQVFDEYIAAGFDKPIDFKIEVYFIFYVDKRSRPDLDNLPAIVLDAIQGKKKKGTKDRTMQVIQDDSLVRYMTAEKIVKGDDLYEGEPRTLVTIKKYNPRGTFGTTV